MPGTKWKTALVAGAMLLAWHGSQAQTVYKWVDASGKTHYGSQPPTSQDAETMKPGKRSFSAAGGSKKTSKEAQELVQDIEAKHGKVDAKIVPLSCGTAVENVRSQLAAMLETGQRNAKQANVKSAEYENAANNIRQARAQATPADCESATGNKKMFYQCMSNDRNHVLGCGTKYKY